jgi:hypothetical protein
MPVNVLEARTLRELVVCSLALYLRRPDAAGTAMCCWAAVRWVTRTSDDYWRKPLSNGVSRMQFLGLETTRRRRLDRSGLEPYAALKATPCPCGYCHGIGRSVLEARYKAICAAGSLRDEAAVIAGVLYDGLGGRSRLCLPFAERWLGVSKYRLEWIIHVVEKALEAGVDVRSGVAFVEKADDGTTWLLGGPQGDRRGGVNRTPDDVKDLIATHFHMCVSVWKSNFEAFRGTSWPRFGRND